MKLLCINDENKQLELYKVYESWGEYEEYFVIEIRKDEVGLFYKTSFTTIEELRDSKLELLGIYG